MTNENLKIIQRVLSVLFFAALSAVMVWRANSYIDPAGYTGMPQLFLCLTGVLFGFTAFSIGLGYGAPEPELK